MWFREALRWRPKCQGLISANKLQAAEGCVWVVLKDARVGGFKV